LLTAPRSIPNSVTQELLDLYQRLKSEAIPQEGLEAVARSLADAKLPNLRDWAYQVTWPDLKVFENHEVSNGFGGAKKRNNNEASDVRLEAMLPSEILKVVLHEHPALVQYRNSLKTDETEEGTKIPVP